MPCVGENKKAVEAMKPINKRRNVFLILTDIRLCHSKRSVLVCVIRK